MLNTHKGLYRPLRLWYGVNAAPAILQRFMERILNGIPGVAVLLDDIKIASKSKIEHIKILELVLKILNDYNVKINLQKCEFFKDQIKYCGHIINKDGIHKDPTKMEAVKKMPKPTNVSELKSFIGMINYYARFIKNLSLILEPLNALLQKNNRFIWPKQCNEAFERAKCEFARDNCMVHFDPKGTLVLACDASLYGGAAVLSHRYKNNTEKPIIFISHSLNKKQRKYTQIDKEAFAIVFAIKRLYQYLYGNFFILITDNKPLVHIFGENKSLPVHSAMRMQHYAIFLQGFNFRIEYRKSENHANADCMSRLPVKKTGQLDKIDAYFVIVQ